MVHSQQSGTDPHLWPEFVPLSQIPGALQSCCALISVVPGC